MSTLNVDKRYLNLLTKVMEESYNRRDGSAELWRSPFRIIVTCVLSQRVRDEGSEAAAKQLFAVADRPESVLAIPTKKLQALIMPSGTYRQKALLIRQLCRALIGQFNGRVPRDREELMRLPGIGPKCADIVLMNAFGIPAIAVDTHVNVVSKRLGFVSKKAGVDDVKRALEGFFPEPKWRYINLGMVNFGRDVCVTRAPLCIESPDNCPFSGFCRAYKTKNFKVKA